MDLRSTPSRPPGHSPRTWLERITAGWHELDGRRAVLLVQLAAGQVRDDARLDYSLALVTGWMRFAVEFRHRAGTARRSSRCSRRIARPTA
ncbi:MAG: hypothetical protein ACRDRJ_02680 [Streptosporangiaceae bacterium]